jgi:hypothetical protein
MELIAADQRPVNDLVEEFVLGRLELRYLVLDTVGYGRWLGSGLLGGLQDPDEVLQRLSGRPVLEEHPKRATDGVVGTVRDAAVRSAVRAGADCDVLNDQAADSGSDPNRVGVEIAPHWLQIAGNVSMTLQVDRGSKPINPIVAGVAPLRDATARKGRRDPILTIVLPCTCIRAGAGHKAGSDRG